MASRREQVRVVDQRPSHSLRDLVGDTFRNILQLLPGEAIELGRHLKPICSNAIVQLGELGLGLRD